MSKKPHDKKPSKPSQSVTLAEQIAAIEKRIAKLEQQYGIAPPGVGSPVPPGAQAAVPGQPYPHPPAPDQPAKPLDSLDAHKPGT